jgi:hypothetical protein
MVFWLSIEDEGFSMSMRERERERELRKCVRKKNGEASGLGKNVSHFSKINKGKWLSNRKPFSVKGKRFYVDYYFTLRQTPVNTENIFRKSFYGETNRALIKKCLFFN